MKVPRPARNSSSAPRLKTLERVASKAGLGSRTDARSWIAAGKFAVNGRTVRDPDHWVDLKRDRISFEGKPLRAVPRRYVLLYKPKGYLTTARDPEGRPTVYDLTRDCGAWLSPVGRLDLDTSGLLLLTNDTDFAERIMNPEYKVAKTYQVKTSVVLGDEQLEMLRSGLQLSDGPTRPAVVKRLRDSERYSFVEITITEGRNRQVRRMIEALGAKVLKLVRTAIGEIRIGDLPIGKWRDLTEEELRGLGGRGARFSGSAKSHSRRR